MKQDFRDRAFLPVMLPLGAVICILVFAFALSRVLLAVPQMVSTFTALLLAGYVLLVAALAATRTRITGRALGVGLFVGLVGIVAAGAVSASAGMRELHEEEAAAEGTEGAEGTDGVAAEIPPDAVVFTAVPTISWAETEKTAPAGETTIAYTNEDTLPHSLAIDELGGVILEGGPGETAVDTFTLEPGTYTYWCDIPGHRQAGMEGTLTVQ